MRIELLTSIVIILNFLSGCQEQKPMLSDDESGKVYALDGTEYQKPVVALTKVPTEIVEGESVILEVNATSKNSNNVTYKWEVIEKPQESNFSLLQKDKKNKVGIVADKEGIYKIMLIVDDGFVTKRVPMQVKVQKRITKQMQEIDINTVQKKEQQGNVIKENDSAEISSSNIDKFFNDLNITKTQKEQKQQNVNVLKVIDETNKENNISLTQVIRQEEDNKSSIVQSKIKQQVEERSTTLLSFNDQNESIYDEKNLDKYNLNRETFSLNIINKHKNIATLKGDDFTKGIVSFDEKYLFIGDVNILKIVSIENLEQPQVKGELDMHGTIKDMVLSQDEKLLFIVISKSFYIVDISQKESPIILSTITMPNYTSTILLSKDENTVFIGCSQNMIIIDVMNPKKPNKVSQFSLANKINSLTFSKDESKIFIGYEGGFQVVDIADLINPFLLTEYKLQGCVSSMKLLNEEDYLIILNVSDGSRKCMRYQGVNIIDISHVDNIKVVYSKLFGGYLRDMKLSEDKQTLYIADLYYGITSYHIEKGVSLIELNKYSSLARAESLLLLKKRKKIIVKKEKELKIIDKNYNSSILSYFNTAGRTHFVTLNLDETKAFLADGSDGVKILDITNTKKLMKKYTVPMYGFTYSVNLSKKYENILYTSGTYSGFFIKIFLTNRTIGKFTPEHTSSNEIRDILISDDETKAFIAADAPGLRILDIAKPNKIKMIVQDRPRRINKLLISKDNNILFIATASGVYIFDVTDSENPIRLGYYRTNSEVYETALSPDETKLYIVEWDKGLTILDISNLEQPTVIGNYFFTQGQNSSLTLSKDGTKVYLARRFHGIELIDILNPVEPKLLKHYDDVPYAYSIALSHDETKAFIASYTAGLSVLDLKNENMYQKINFENFALELQIDSISKNTVFLSIDVDDSNIISVGNYESKIELNKETRKKIVIPINAIRNKTGEAKIFIRLKGDSKEIYKIVHLHIWK